MSHLVVVHLVWFPNTMRIAVGFPNLMHDHEVRPRLTRYDLVLRGATSSHKVRPRLTRSCVVLGNQTLPHFVGISNGMLLGKCVHTNCHSALSARLLRTGYPPAFRCGHYGVCKLGVHWLCTWYPHTWYPIGQQTSVWFPSAFSFPLTTSHRVVQCRATIGVNTFAKQHSV